jgi:O-acetyl-ADP-ribose deacetylase (regulator of RNase III)
VTTANDGATSTRTSSYLIGNCTFTVMFGNLVNVMADALVSSDDSYLTMGGGVSAALNRAGGDQVAFDAQKHVPLTLGDVAVTTAGLLPAKYIFHGVTIDLDRQARPDADCLQLITHRCLHLAETLRLRHVAFPALGTGAGSLPFELAADTITTAIADFLSQQPRYLREVTVVLRTPGWHGFSEPDLFYERAVALAAQRVDGRRLRELVSDLEAILARNGSESLRERAARLLEGLADAEATLGDTTTVRAPADRDALNIFEPASGEADDLASRSAAVVDWEDIKARETVLQLRLQSLRTQHNIMIGNRNQLEERRAKYGPTAVPLEVENALTDTVAEILAKEDEIRSVKSALDVLSKAGSARP